MQDKIRVMTQDDLDIVLNWRNHEDVRRFMYTQHSITLEEHKRWFDRASLDNQKYLLIFQHKETPMGFVQFSQLNNTPIADWGFYAAPDAPKGTGKRMGRTALRYAFDQLEFHKVCGQALAYNERSIEFHLTLGFKQEGLLRQQHFDGHNYHDVYCFGLLAIEWHVDN